MILDDSALVFAFFLFLGIACVVLTVLHEYRIENNPKRHYLPEQNKGKPGDGEYD